MLCEVPLTKEQQTFATAHHSLAANEGRNQFSLYDPS